MPRWRKVMRGMTGTGLTFAAAVGAGGGLLLFGALALNAWDAWSISTAVANATLFVLLGGGAATTTLVVARRAAPTLEAPNDLTELGEG